MKNWTRREFLEAGVLSSIALRTTASLSSAPDNQIVQKQGRAATIQTDQRPLLRVVMDEFIPAGDGMPAASEVGGVNYLEMLAGRDAKVAKGLGQSLAAIEELSGQRFQASFLQLPQEKRVAVLDALENQDGENFRALRDWVYQAYYEQPQVWKLIGYTFYPTDGGGPSLKPFNEEVLAEVRKKPKYYREV